MARYKPEAVPQDEEELRTWLSLELQRISAAFSGIEEIILPTLHVAPDKPREGMVILVDGTDFNPGSGAGFYGYRGGAWVLLG